MNISQSPRTTVKIKIELLLAYVLPILLLSPSIIWIARDKTVWPWDQAWYGRGSVELFQSLVNSPTHWVVAMLNSLRIKAPGIAWLGQFFVPLGYLMRSVDVGLMMSVLVTQALVLIVTYWSVRELSSKKTQVAILGCVVIASAPLYVGLSHQYLVEPMQTLAVAWFVLIMSFAPRWNRAFILSQLLVATPFAMLAKVSSPLYCWGPGLVALGYSLWPKQPQSKNQKLEKHVIVTLALGLLLSLVTTAWYYRNMQYVVKQVSTSASGPIAELYGKKDAYLSTMGFWLGAARSSFFLPSVFVLGVLVFAGGGICYFIRHKTLTDHFTLCGGIAIVQLISVLAVFALSPNRDTRYLLPLVPYCAILICWGATQINRPILTSLVIAVFAVQFVVVHGQALGMTQRNPSISRWVIPANSDARDATTLDSIVSRTCTEASRGRYNFIGVELSWLNSHSVSYAAAKNLAQHNLQCYYIPLGYVESDADKIWNLGMSVNILYYIVVDPALYPVPPDAFNQIASPMLKRVQTSGLFELEPSIDDTRILIFRHVK